jgi:hypothetical protein
MKYLAIALFLTMAAQPVSAFQPLPSLQLQRIQLSSKASSFVAPIARIGHELKLQVRLQSAVSEEATAAQANEILDNEEVSVHTAMLLDAIGYNATAATALLSHIQSEKDTFLDALLTTGPDASPMPFWAHSKRLARTSKRARWASLSRVLNQAASKSDTTRGQALVMVLEALQSIAGDKSGYGSRPGIVVLEDKSIKDPMTFVTMTRPLPGMDVESMMEPETSLPAGVEAEDKVEIPETTVVVAETATSTEAQVVNKVSDMFRRLAKKSQQQKQGRHSGH